MKIELSLSTTGKLRLKPSAHLNIAKANDPDAGPGPLYDKPVLLIRRGGQQPFGSRSSARSDAQFSTLDLQLEEPDRSGLQKLAVPFRSYPGVPSP